MLYRTLLILGLAAVLAGCTRADPVLPAGGTIAAGTWGGDNAGLVLQDSLVHVHIGCTNGYFSAPVSLDAAQRFNVAGRYVLRAFPIQMGPDLPAQFAGVVEGSKLTFTVAVNDTVEKKMTVLGPVTVTYKREPSMQTCPICRTPAGLSPAAQ